jgi:hypothetical protein
VGRKLILEGRDCGREGEEGNGLQGRSQKGWVRPEGREGEGSAQHTTSSVGTVKSQVYQGDLSSLADLYHLELHSFEVPDLLIPQPERFSLAFPYNHMFIPILLASLRDIGEVQGDVAQLRD